MHKSVHSESHAHKIYFQILESALAALQTLNSSDFAQTADSFLQPYTHLPAYTDSPFELPSVLVPPEVIELDSLSTDSGEDALVKKEEWAEYYLRLFENDDDTEAIIICGEVGGTAEEEAAEWIRNYHARTKNPK